MIQIKTLNQNLKIVKKFKNNREMKFIFYVHFY